MEMKSQERVKAATGLVVTMEAEMKCLHPSGVFNRSKIQNGRKRLRISRKIADIKKEWNYIWQCNT